MRTGRPISLVPSWLLVRSPVTDELPEMTSSYQLFDLLLEVSAVLSIVSDVSVVSAVQVLIPSAFVSGQGSGRSGTPFLLPHRKDPSPGGSAGSPRLVPPS